MCHICINPKAQLARPKTGDVVLSSSKTRMTVSESWYVSGQTGWMVECTWFECEYGHSFREDGRFWRNRNGTFRREDLVNIINWLNEEYFDKCIDLDDFYYSHHHRYLWRFNTTYFLEQFCNENGLYVIFLNLEKRAQTDLVQKLITDIDRMNLGFEETWTTFQFVDDEDIVGFICESERDAAILRMLTEF